MLTTPQVREEVFSYVDFFATYDSTRGRKGLSDNEFVSVMEEGLGDPFKTIREPKMTVT